jgi:hypothetical protein
VRTRVCLAVAFVAVVLGLGAASLPVDHCGLAWKAAFDPHEALASDGLYHGIHGPIDPSAARVAGPVILPRPGAPVPDPSSRNPALTSSGRNAVAIFRSSRFCEQTGKTRLAAAAVAAATAVVAAVGVAAVLAGSRNKSSPSPADRARAPKPGEPSGFSPPAQGAVTPP